MLPCMLLQLLCFHVHVSGAVKSAVNGGDALVTQWHGLFHEYQRERERKGADVLNEGKCLQQFPFFFLAEHYAK